MGGSKAHPNQDSYTDRLHDRCIKCRRQGVALVFAAPWALLARVQRCGAPTGSFRRRQDLPLMPFDVWQSGFAADPYGEFPTLGDGNDENKDAKNALCGRPFGVGADEPDF